MLYLFECIHVTFLVDMPPSVKKLLHFVTLVFAFTAALRADATIAAFALQCSFPTILVSSERIFLKTHIGDTHVRYTTHSCVCVCN